MSWFFNVFGAVFGAGLAVMSLFAVFLIFFGIVVGSDPKDKDRQ